MDSKDGECWCWIEMTPTKMHICIRLECHFEWGHVCLLLSVECIENLIFSHASQSFQPITVSSVFAMLHERHSFTCFSFAKTSKYRVTVRFGERRWRTWHTWFRIQHTHTRARSFELMLWSEQRCCGSRTIALFAEMRECFSLFAHKHRPE